MTTVQPSDSFVYRDPAPSQQMRRRLRELIAAKLPNGWLGPFTNDPADLELSNQFCQALASEGLLVPDWPARYGGRDLELASSVVIREEMWANFEPRGGQYYGPNWIGPSILAYGTEEQKALHLPQIAAGKAIWCQGFSEPDAGSDLASLRTRALPDGDGFRITGQKIWTSWALWADWCYLLARVGSGHDARHEGITVFLIPMNRDGITVRGLDGIPGPHHLTEVFLDDVRAEATEVLGGVGNGWQVIRDALSNERVGIARYARGDRLIADVVGCERYRKALPEGRWLQARIRNRMARLLCRRALWFQNDGASHDFIVSAARMITTRADLTVADALSEAVGDAFFEDRYTPDAALSGALDFYWRYMQAGTIASGTTEMLQRQLSRAMFGGARIRVTPEAKEIRASVDRLLADRGGVEMARSAITEPDARREMVAVLDTVIESLDPRDGLSEGTAAAEICRAAGRVVLPLPIEAMLLRRPAGRRPLVALSPHSRFEHADLFPEWDALTSSGEVTTVAGTGELIGSKVGPFVNRVPLDSRASAASASVAEQALLPILGSWYVLGALEQALDLATVYATQRVTFGAPIASYQGVAFPLADACAELQALYELALHALWSSYETPANALVDALALRWASLDIARRVLRTCHQVFGAVGLCDEHDLTIITLCLQGRLRLPTGPEATMAALAQAVKGAGFDSIYTPSGGQHPRRRTS